MRDDPRQTDDERREGESHQHVDHDAGHATEPFPKDPAAEPVCAICGHPIEQDDIVCPNCGTNLVAG
jgi:rubrerythrin